MSYPFGLHPRVVAEGGQDRDHPVHPALPETDYLRAFFVEFAASDELYRAPEEAAAARQARIAEPESRLRDLDRTLP